jgi:hypothetical protein
VRFNAIILTYTSGQPEDMNAVCDLGHVVEDAFERNSWGKSRSDQMCCFPNTRGFHCTSGDAPFETKTSLTTMIQKVHILQQQHSMQIATIIGKLVHSVKSWAGWDSPRIHLGATCMNPILHHQEGPKLLHVHIKTNHTNLLLG